MLPKSPRQCSRHDGIRRVPTAEQIIDRHVTVFPIRILDTWETDVIMFDGSDVFAEEVLSFPPARHHHGMDQLQQVPWHRVFDKIIHDVEDARSVMRQLDAELEPLNDR